MILAPMEKQNLHLNFYFYLMSKPFEFRTEILHFYMYFGWKTIPFHRPKLLHIFIFILRQQLFKKSPVNPKI